MKTTIENIHVEAMASMTSKKYKTIFLGCLTENGQRIYSDKTIAEFLQTSENSVKFYVKSDGSVRTQNLNRQRSTGSSKKEVEVSSATEINALFGAIGDYNRAIEAKLAEIEELKEKKQKALSILSDMKEQLEQLGNN